MAEDQVIHNMILSFRLQELHSLLNYAGKSKSGRKRELQKRALDLLPLNSDDITIKIRELNNEMTRRIGTHPPDMDTDRTSPPLPLLSTSTSSRGAASSRRWRDEEVSEEAPLSNRRTRSTRTRVSYVEPDEDEASEVLSESSSSSVSSSEELAAEEEEGSYTSPSGGDVVESDADSEGSGSSLSDSAPNAPIINKKVLPQHNQVKANSNSYAPPNILRKTNRKKAPSPVSNTKSSHCSLSKDIVPVPPPPSESKHESRLMYPPCPDVQLIPLPFYKVEAVLLKPSSLNPCNIARFQAQNFVFHLTPSQASAIARSSYQDENGKLEYKNQIQMRFCLNETSCPQDDNFPGSVCVIVNGRPQSLPNIIPTNKPGVDPKRPPKPINITGNCKLSATLPNYLNVTWTVEAGKGFCVAIYYVEKLTSNSLIKMLKDKGNRHPAYTKAIIKDKLNDRDCEIATTSCKVTLACPLGKMRMSLPCRATTCDHLQCFDARLYIQMNERKPKWICPVCNKNAIFENLMVDGYFQEVLNDPKLGSGENEIVLKNDATWEPLPTKGDESSSSHPKPTKTPPPSSNKKDGGSFETVDVVDDDDDVISEPSKSRATSKSSDDKIVECITLDDSEDEEPPPELHPAKKLRIVNDSNSDDYISLSSSSCSSASNSNQSASVFSSQPTDEQFGQHNKQQLLSSSSAPKNPPALIFLSEDEDD